MPGIEAIDTLQRFGTLNVRTASPADTDAVAAMLTAYATEITGEFPLQSQAVYCLAVSLCHQRTGLCFVLPDNEGRPVGMVTLQDSPREPWDSSLTVILGRLYIYPDCRGLRAVASLLLAGVKAAKLAGASRLWGKVESGPRRFYSRFTHTISVQELELDQ